MVGGFGLFGFRGLGFRVEGGWEYTVGCRVPGGYGPRLQGLEGLQRSHYSLILRSPIPNL